MTRRLRVAAEFLGATGLIVWTFDAEARELVPFASHGYDEMFLASVGGMSTDAPNMTAASFRDARVRVRVRRNEQAAGLSAPVMGPDGPMGVLTVEFGSGPPAVGADVEASTRLLASHLASLMAVGVPGEPPKPGPMRVVTPPRREPAQAAAPPWRPAALQHFPLETPPAPAGSHTGDEHSEVALREARGRFIAGFRKRCVAIDELIDGIETLGAQGPVVALRQIAHRLAGLAGTVGMPEVSQAAIALDRMLAEETADPARLRRACAELLVGFSVDLAAVPPSWVVAEGAARGAHVLLVERDPRVAAGLQADLCGAGYRVSHAMSGDRAMAIVQTDVPDLVLLDLETPGQPDGYGVCRRLKSDPALLAIPVVILSNAAASVDRVAGFALGADEYLAKPIETIELLHRVRWMLSRPATERQIVASGGGELLTADAFLAAARELLRQVPGALALVRVTPAQVTDVSALLADDLRRKDLVGRYSETQIAVLMPGASAGVALKRLSTVLERARAAGLDGLVAGVTVSGHRQQRLIEPLLAQAEAAQASAHVPGELVSVHGVIGRTSTATILVVDDDPDVVHMVDSRLKASGLATALAFDGEEALRQIDTRAPALVVLGLTLPKLSGFDLLARIRELPEPRPRVVAVSGHSDEENLTRAFSLGADDYLTKPFNPHELLVRINRLIR